jgi:glycosyltransferase involved in cell wall biosynthesis
LQNEDLRRKMGSNSLMRARGLFSMDGFVDRLEQYYERLTATQNGRVAVP